MPITRLQHGISQAIARHVLTHKTEPSGGWTLDGLIKTVAGEIDDVNMRHRRREARADADGLAAAGVLLEDDRVRRCAPKPGCDVVGVQQNRDGVQQNRDGVQQNRDGVQQNRDACSKTAMRAAKPRRRQIHIQIQIQGPALEGGRPIMIQMGRPFGAGEESKRR